MLILRNIIIVILLLVLAAISVVGIMVEAPQVINYTPDRINALGRSVLTVMRPDYLLFFTWILIFLGTLLVFFMTVLRPRKRMKIEVQMGGGRVVIMDAAIKKYIRNALAEINEVTVKKIELREQRGLVTTDIYADVRTRENLPVLERRIIGRVRGALAEDLGITNLGDVHVYIRNFEVTGRPITPAPAPAKQPETSTKPVVEAESAQINDTGRIADIDTEPLTEPSPATPAAAMASSSGVITAGALAEPIEPPGSTSPIIISDTDSDTDTDNEPVTEAAPAWQAGQSATEGSSYSTLSSHEKLTIPEEEAKSPTKDEIDEPLPWGVYKRPTAPDDEKREDKDQLNP